MARGLVLTSVSGVPEGSQRGPPRAEQTPLVFLFLCTAMVSGHWGTGLPETGAILHLATRGL